MIPAIEALNRVAVAWAGLAWAVAWQALLLVLVCLLVARALGRSSPALRHWFWQIVAIKLLVMPFWSVPITVPALPRAAPETPPEPPRLGQPEGGMAPGLTLFPPAFDPLAAADGPPSEPQSRSIRLTSFDWRAGLFLTWVAVVVLQVVTIVRQYRRLRRLLLRASPADDPALLALVLELSGRIGLRKPPGVLIAEGEVSPFVCGLRRPVLVLPVGLADALSPRALRSVLLHELAHLRRRDLLWDWIPTLARLLYAFHPAALIVASRVRLERELACDQAAMALTGQDAAGYASTLVEVVSRRSSGPSALRAALMSAGLDGSDSYPAPPSPTGGTTP